MKNPLTACPNRALHSDKVGGVALHSDKVGAALHSDKVALHSDKVGGLRWAA